MQKIYDNIQYAFHWFDINDFMTKLDVYNMTDIIRAELTAPKEKAVNPFSIIDNYPETLGLQFHSFDSDKIGGFIVKNNPEFHMSIITLNDSKPPESIKFNCCHELIHFFKHPCDSYTCASYLNNGEPFEYQANEGAAELLIPFRDAVPFIADQWEEARIISEKDPRWGNLPFAFIPLRMSQKYGVSEKIAEYRISSLNYETYQYINGKDLDNLQIISKRKQEEKSIVLPSLPDLCRAGNAALDFLPEDTIMDYTEKYKVKTNYPLEWDDVINETYYVTDEELELLDRLKFGE